MDVLTIPAKLTAIEQRQALYEGLLVTDSWSAEHLQAHQQFHIKRLLHFARGNVPFYASRLDPLFRPDGSIDWARWGEIPIVRRSDMVEHREAMQARLLPVGYGPASFIDTSGSTGLPLRVTVSRSAEIIASALAWRSHQWAGIDWGSTILSRLGDSEHATEFSDGEDTGPFGPPMGPPQPRGRVWRISRDFDTPTMVHHFRRVGARYLNSGPNMAHINALDCERMGIELRIDKVLAQGNVVTPADRAACKRVFGADIVEFYSAKEGGQMASRCPEGRLHVHSEGTLVEVLKDDGSPCGPGETGRVIVTPLFQVAQPLIRYEQGDWAIVGEPCPCGRAHPVLDGIKGRSVAIFLHPDGRRIAALMPDETREVLDCAYFQLAQVGPNRYELRYVPNTDQRTGDETEVRRLFHQNFFPDADLRFVRTDRIPLTSGGKLVEYFAEWRPS